jgi:hypothetical protein
MLSINYRIVPIHNLYFLSDLQSFRVKWGCVVTELRIATFGHLAASDSYWSPETWVLGGVLQSFSGCPTVCFSASLINRKSADTAHKHGSQP